MGEQPDATDNRDYDHALLALRQMRREGIDVNSLTDEQIAQLLDVYVLSRKPSPETQAIIDEAQNKNEGV